MKQNYRAIWEKANGPIPLDSNGKKMEIHHIDGDRTNNALDNLLCISVEDHYDIHFNQADYWACAAISKRMNMTSEQRTMLSDKIRAANAIHNARKNKAKSEKKRAEIIPAVQYYLDNVDKTVREVADVFQCSFGLLRTVLSEMNATRTKGSYMTSTSEAARSYRDTLISTSHLTCKEASVIMGIHANTVAVYRRTLGIKSGKAA